MAAVNKTSIPSSNVNIDWKNFFSWMKSKFPISRDKSSSEEAQAYFDATELEKKKLRQEMQRKIEAARNQVYLNFR